MVLCYGSPKKLIHMRSIHCFVLDQFIGKQTLRQRLSLERFIGNALGNNTGKIEGSRIGHWEKVNFNVVVTEAFYRSNGKQGLGILLSCTKLSLGAGHLCTHMDRSLEAFHH